MFTSDEYARLDPAARQVAIESSLRDLWRAHRELAEQHDRTILDLMIRVVRLETRAAVSASLVGGIAGVVGTIVVRLLG